MRNRYPKKDLLEKTQKQEEKKEEVQEKPHFVLEIQDATISLDSLFSEPKKEG
jgi:hypothetical protein